MVSGMKTRINVLLYFSIERSKILSDDKVKNIVIKITILYFVYFLSNSIVRVEVGKISPGQHKYSRSSVIPYALTA